MPVLEEVLPSNSRWFLKWFSLTLLSHRFNLAWQPKDDMHTRQKKEHVSMEEHRKEEVNVNQEIGMVKGILTQLGNQRKRKERKRTLV